MQKNAKNTNTQIQPDLAGLETILDSMSVGICYLNGDGAIRYANSFAARLFGKEVVELYSQPYQVCFFGKDTTSSDDRCQPIEFTLTEGETSHINKETLLGPNGSNFLAELICMPVLKDGRPQGAVISFQDVTDRVDVEDSIADSRDRALDASRSKAEFLANMSHEIRTPLTGILGTVDLLSTTNLDTEQAEYIRILRSSTEFLHTVVNNILDFSKIEAGEFVINNDKFSLTKLLGECLDIHRLVASAKKIEMTLDLDDNLSDLVTGDKQGIRHILNNLLSNALKFTDSGFIKLLIQKSEIEDRVRFLVIDSGVGIEADLQKHLFKPFTQADASDKRSFEGTGLGLTISKRLVSLMKGEIGFSSESGTGSEFWFEIELPGVAEGSSVSAAHFPSLSVEQTRAMILVVEDNPVNAMVISRMIKRLGMASQTAPDGPTAIKLCSEKQFDLVFMDCQMPGMDGYETASVISKEAENNLKIVAFTASVGNNELGRLERSGMHGILRKPFTEKQLIQILKEQLETSIDRKNLDLDSDKGENSQLHYIDDKTRRELMKLDHDDPHGFLCEIMNIYSDHLEKGISELEDFIVTGNVKGIKQVCHSLKVSSERLGFYVLADLFKELELVETVDDQAKNLFKKIDGGFVWIQKAIRELNNEESSNESK